MSLLPSPSPSHSHTTIEETLDADLIAQEVAHGVLDIASLARFMGSTLKMHCAPMRDEAVDRMVDSVVQGGDITRGLRMCFELLELMKLVSAARIACALITC